MTFHFFAGAKQGATPPNLRFPTPPELLHRTQNIMHNIYVSGCADLKYFIFDFFRHLLPLVLKIAAIKTTIPICYQIGVES